MIFEEIHKIKNRKVGSMELDRAKEYLIGSMLMGLEGTSNRMINLAQSVIYYNKIKSVEETVRLIRKVNAEDIREYANELFDSSNKFDRGSLIKVILSPKNLLFSKAA